MVLKNPSQFTELPRTHVCPLCPLHCDDLHIDPAGNLIADGCPIVDDFPTLSSLPTDRGDWDASAVDSVRPLRLVTTGVDLSTARGLSQWQRDGRIELVIESDPSVQSIHDVASRDGTVSATLADVATHADQVWLIGRVEETWPRIAQKLRLITSRGEQKSVTRFSHRSAAELTELAARIDSTWTNSRYTAILIGPDAFVAGEEAISATMINRLVRLRNANSRCVLVTLDAGATLRSVCLWQTNTSPSTSVLNPGIKAFDIRIGSPLNTDSRPASLQIGGLDWGTEYATAYRASSIAGLHHAGMVIRGDGSVSLPLAAPVDTQLPGPCDVLLTSWNG